MPENEGMGYGALKEVVSSDSARTRCASFSLIIILREWLMSATDIRSSRPSDMRRPFELSLDLLVESNKVIPP